MKKITVENAIKHSQICKFIDSKIHHKNLTLKLTNLKMLLNPVLQLLFLAYSVTQLKQQLLSASASALKMSSRNYHIIISFVYMHFDNYDSRSAAGTQFSKTNRQTLIVYKHF